MARLRAAYSSRRAGSASRASRNPLMAGTSGLDSGTTWTWTRNEVPSWRITPCSIGRVGGKAVGITCGWNPRASRSRVTAGISSGDEGSSRSMVPLPARAGTAELPTCSASAPGRPAAMSAITRPATSRARGSASRTTMGTRQYGSIGRRIAPIQSNHDELSLPAAGVGGNVPPVVHAVEVDQLGGGVGAGPGVGEVVAERGDGQHPAARGADPPGRVQALAVGARVAARGEHHGDAGPRVPADLVAGERPLGGRPGEVRQVGAHARQDGLGLGVPEAAVELEDAGAVGGQGQ